MREVVPVAHVWNTLEGDDVAREAVADRENAERERAEVEVPAREAVVAVGGPLVAVASADRC